MISVAMTRGGGLTPAHEHHVLVNLDADNIMADSFPANLQASLYPPSSIESTLVADASRALTAAQQAAFCATTRPFWLLAGMIKSFHPTGFQDIDLHKRLIKMCGPESAPAFRLMCGWSAQLQGIAHTQAHHSKDQLFRQSLDLGQTRCRESNNGGSDDECRPVVEKLLGGSLQWKANVGHYEPNWAPGSGRLHCVSWGPLSIRPNQTEHRQNLRPVV